MQAWKKEEGTKMLYKIGLQTCAYISQASENNSLGLSLTQCPPPPPPPPPPYPTLLLSNLHKKSTVGLVV